MSRAQARPADLPTDLELAERLGSLSTEQVNQTMDRIVLLAKQLSAQRQALLRNG